LGVSPPDDYKEIPLRMIFDVKMDFPRKARLVAGGHLTDPPEALTYSSVVSRRSVRLAFMLAKLNDLEMISTNIRNAHLNAEVTEKNYAIAGPKFGELQGCTVVVVNALYCLKSAGAAWNHHLTNELEFEPFPADPNVWRRAHVKSDGTKYYEYVFVYVDELLCLSVDPVGRIIQPLSDLGYRCKDVGKPTRYLGTEIAEHEIRGADGTVHKFWSMSAEQYLKLAI
jgi:hypothetical protein